MHVEGMQVISHMPDMQRGACHRGLHSQNGQEVTQHDIWGVLPPGPAGLGGRDVRRSG